MNCEAEVIDGLYVLKRLAYAIELDYGRRVSHGANIISGSVPTAHGTEFFKILFQSLGIKIWIMATITTNYSGHAPADMAHRADRVISVLRWTYGLVPIAAGADKFTHILTDWNQYLAPAVANVVPFSPDVFMSIVGIIEIIAGIIVLVRPKIGIVIVACWLLGIVINLLLTGQYFDIAVRDLVMAIGAFSLHTLVNGRHNGY